MPVGKINESLLKERKKCTFNIQELTHFIDGSEKETQERKKIEEVVLNTKELWDAIPEEYLSHKDRYENVIRKVCVLTNIMKEHVGNRTDMDKFAPLNTYKIAGAVTKDVSPFMLHMGMFIPTIIGQANDEQLEKWLGRALQIQIIGTYAQTELGHGTFIRGLETTATYDPQTEEFILNSPSLTAYKWWPGGLAHTANHCIVVAQLFTQGKNHGIHPFIIQIRDEETHMPLPGISIGEIGPKMGFQTANNGFLGFKNVRIPRDAMLMKNSQVLKDGTFISSKHEKLTYGTMVFVRVLIVNDAAFELGKAATIAIRYSAVRHQSQIKADEPERQILDYVTQQHKLFIALAASHAMRVIGRWLWVTYIDSTKQMKAGNMDMLPELHALACCLKAVSTADAAVFVEKCRLACGGHGYMLSSNLPIIYGHVTAANTYEGENTVLLLQTARYLVKAWEKASIGGANTTTVAYLNKPETKWENSPEGIIRGMQSAAAGHIKSAVEALSSHIKKGVSAEEAWNLVSVQLVGASEAHCRAVMCEVQWNEIQRLSKTVSKNLMEVLAQLAELYLVYWALERIGDLLLYSNISKDDVIVLKRRYEELLAKIRPNAVGLVDSFDFCDEMLASALGAYDGRVYERLMEEALKSPLNAEPVNQSFHKYLKPFMQGKL